MGNASERRVFSPFTINGSTLRNRFVRSATFEGMTQGGEPSQRLVELHRRTAAGGVGMTTVASAAVSASARTHGHQLSMVKDGILPGLRRLTDAVHSEGAAAAIQLVHGGAFASPAVTGQRTIGPSRVLDRRGLTWPRPMTEDDMESVADDFARAALLSREAGFDAIELHAGHGYLISQFLSPHTNRRTDRWGGSLGNRFRFAALVLRRVRDALGVGFPILAKMNLRDGFEGGLELDEAVEVGRMFEAEGIDALVLSGGFAGKTPLYVFRGDAPLEEPDEGQRSLAKKVGDALAGRWLVKGFPYRDNFFLEDSRAVRAALRVPLVQAGGLRKLDDMERICVDEGFELLSLGRPLVMEPDLVARMSRGEAAASRCVPCNQCIGAVDKGGLYCPQVEERGKPCVTSATGSS
jgi:2,4-dienoyl-CoA reductase-like NADH-dependent reductase (Old Yellow Enzyme family)